MPLTSRATMAHGSSGCPRCPAATLERRAAGAASSTSGARRLLSAAAPTGQATGCRRGSGARRSGSRWILPRIITLMARPRRRTAAWPARRRRRSTRALISTSGAAITMLRPPPGPPACPPRSPRPGHRLALAGLGGGLDDIGQRRPQCDRRRARQTAADPDAICVAADRTRWRVGPCLQRGPVRCPARACCAVPGSSHYHPERRRRFFELRQAGLEGWPPPWRR